MSNFPHICFHWSAGECINFPRFTSLLIHTTTFDCIRKTRLTCVVMTSGGVIYHYAHRKLETLADAHQELAKLSSASDAKYPLSFVAEALCPPEEIPDLTKVILEFRFSELQRQILKPGEYLQ